jgi:hypothetical protein
MSVTALPERRGRAAVVDSRYKPDQLSFLFSARGFGAAVAAGKFLDAPGRIHELLFTGEKGMTSSADTDLNIVARGAGVIHRTACAHNIGLVILWMNTGLHLWKGARNLLLQRAPRKR